MIDRITCIQLSDEAMNASSSSAALLLPSDLLGASEGFKVKVSSVLNRAADFQAKHMFSTDDYCWNSAGSEDGVQSEDGQWLQIEFLGDTTANVERIEITFQGGFVGSDGIVSCGPSKSAMVEACVLEHLHSINDCNDVQTWDLPAHCADGIKVLRVTFPRSTDFFGRITIYRLQLYGQRV